MIRKPNIRATTLLAGAMMLPAGAMAVSPTADVVMFQTETVKYNPALAAKAAGARALYSRLKRAARHVCEDNVGERRPLAFEIAIARCVNEAMDSAVAQVNSPAVTTLHMHGRKAGTAAMAVATR